MISVFLLKSIICPRWKQSADFTVSKNNEDVTVVLKTFSSLQLYESHSLQKCMKDLVQICSSVLLYKSKHMWTHSKTLINCECYNSSLTCLGYIWLTVYFEIFHFILEIDVFFVKEVENADDFGNLGGEKEDFVVWGHAKGWNLWR